MIYLESLWKNLSEIVGLIIGILLILFRKWVVNSVIREQLRRTKNKTKETIKPLDETGYMMYLHKFMEVIIALIGFIFTISSLQKLIFPGANKFSASIFIFPGLCAFSAAGAALVTFLMYPILSREVDRHLSRKYSDLWQKSKSLSVTDKVESLKLIKNTDDPVLQRLRKRTVVYTFSLFLISFIGILFMLYRIVKP